MRVLALDYGKARCGCAVSDPTGVLATPLQEVHAPDSPRGMARLRELAAELEAERVVVGLPLTLAGRDSAQTVRTRAFAARLAARLPLPVELYDERLTTRLAERTGGRAGVDSRAAAHLLETWLASQPGGGGEERDREGARDREPDRHDHEGDGHDHEVAHG